MSPAILVINTGGTFNKYYNPLSGHLEVDTKGAALKTLTQKWQTEIEHIDIIGKDSLDMTGEDRLEILAIIHQSHYEKIIIIHGTDTMHLTAQYLNDADIEKQIVLTGAMVPYSIDPVEATANFASAYGFINSLQQNGIYIAMNSTIGSWKNVQKIHSQGSFQYRKHSYNLKV